MKETVPTFDSLVHEGAATVYWVPGYQVVTNIVIGVIRASIYETHVRKKGERRQ